MTHVKGRSHKFENGGLIMGFGKLRYKNFGLDMCLFFRSLVLRSIPLFFGLTVYFQLQLETEVLSLAKPPSWMEAENGQTSPKIRGIDLETKLLKVRHMSKPKFFLFWWLNFVSKPACLNVCGLHMRSRAQCMNSLPFLCTCGHFILADILIRALRASPFFLEFTFAYMNEKWPPSMIQMHT